MYKYKNIIAFFATLIWLSFIFSAFEGFVYWYGGFVIFFWIAIGCINYRHESSFWLLFNRPIAFFKYFVVLFLLGYFADYIIGQKLAQLWSYPPYHSIFDWLRLYTIIYPVGGLSVVELIYFLGSLFGERFTLQNKPGSLAARLEYLTDALLAITVVAYIVSRFSAPIPNLRLTLVLLLLLWTVIATFKLRYQIKHWSHWVSILFATLFMSLFLHEIPNTAVYEWRYYPAPIFNQQILQVPLWVFFGWYLLILLMLRFWMYFVLAKKRR